ncbi:MAG TPA: hypothetical protein VKA34_17415, partial [Balneolales bacterium]|nr:hypothetical protein [Balneolales bacterium]
MNRYIETNKVLIILIFFIFNWIPLQGQTINRSALKNGQPDLILIHGKVFTAESNNPWVEAVAIRGDKIEAVGTNSAIRQLAGPETRIFNLKGHVLVPGLTDAHVHPIPDDGSIPVVYSKDAGMNPAKDELKA